MKTLKSILLFFCTVSVSMWFFMCAGLWYKQEAFIFPVPYGRMNSLPHNGPYKMGTLQTSDDLTLSFLEVAPKDNMPVIIFFHGNGELASDKGFLRREPNPGSSLQEYAKLGFGIISAEYRGYSGNEGRPTEQGVIIDAHAYYQYVHTTWKNSKIILYGESLGTGVAIGLATDTPVDGLVLDAPFTSIHEIVTRTFPIIPISLLERNPFTSSARLSTIKAPIFVVHGIPDSVIPVDMGVKIADKAPCSAGLLVLPVNHIASALDMSGQAGMAIKKFILSVADSSVKCLR